MEERDQPPTGRQGGEELARLASLPRRGLLAELWAYLARGGKWWLLPALLALLLVGLLALASQSALGPFVYTLF